MYCSTSVSAHLMRGALALASIAGGIAWAPHYWPALGLIPLAIYFMRGCPACWFMGLLQAVQNRSGRKQAP